MTTLAQLQAGNPRIAYTCAIEGYKRLLYYGTTGAGAEAAWTGQDRAGLGTTHVEMFEPDLENSQELNPWDPFTGGGTCKIYVPSGGADTFAIEVNKRNIISATSVLTTSLDRDDTTVMVKSNAFAPAGPSEIHIGTECIGYTAKSGTTDFTGCTRGKYPAFAKGGGSSWSMHHRVGLNTSGINMAPEVTLAPRRWPGRWVGVWAHAVTAAGVLDTKANAVLVFAGRLVQIEDALVGGARCTVLNLQHVLDEIKDASVGQDMWSARVKEGIYLLNAMTFSFKDTTDIAAVAYKSANDLQVGSGSFPVGFYTADDLYSILNAWLATEQSAGRLYGTYQIMPGPLGDFGVRTKVHWRIPSAGTHHTRWQMTLPGLVAKFFGFAAADTHDTDQQTIDDDGPDDTETIYDGKYEPLRHIFQAADAYNHSELELEEERGTFSDQYASLPGPLKPGPGPGATGSWGVFLVDNKFLIVARKNGSTLEEVFRPQWTTGLKLFTDTDLNDITYTVSQPNVVPIRQIFVLEMGFATLVSTFLYSTGTTAYNNATYDTLPTGLGLGIPGELLSALTTTIATVPDANGDLVAFLTESTKFSDLVKGDFVLRHVFLRWKSGTSGGSSSSGSIECRAWTAPDATNSVATLDEATKAAPAGTKDDHRTPMIEDDVFARPLIKIDFNRDITASNDDTYNDSVTFVDQTALDDAGGAGKPFTIQARNTYREFSGTGASVEALAPNFLALLPLFSRPMRRLTRSIDMRYFEGLAPGDTVLVSDSFARSPETGLPGLSAIPGIVLKHKYTFGGRRPNAQDTDAMHGEIDLMVLDADRTAQYAPAAIVDNTAANGGLDAGTSTIFTCYAHKCSESSESADASYFPAGTKLRIVERDPATSSSPLTWQRTVQSQSGNTITVSAAISAPAWDSSKKYITTFDDFTTSVAAQQTRCYQADDADNLVEDARVPFAYNSVWPTYPGAFTVNAANDEIELPADLSYGDGKALDVAHERALTRLANNILDYKSAHSSPQLGVTMSGSGATGTYKLVQIRPVFLSPECFSNGTYRVVTAAPWLRSSDGTAATVRFTLSRTMPSQDTINDITLSGDAVSQTWSSSSTTWATGSDKTFDLRGLKFPGFAGIVYLVVECTVKAETRGAAKFQEGPRLP